jgi:spermidine synthase
MSLLWSQLADGVRYEVRAAGQTRRLYTNGVFHSQYNPSRPITGGVWDLMMLPAFLLPHGSVRRVLLLGVGGGTVIRQLQEFVRPDFIHALELNSVHIEIAERFFGIGSSDVHLEQGDAIEWVRNYRGKPFDLVIDDLFGEEAGEPMRAIEADNDWCAALEKLVSPQGAVVINTLGPAAARRAAESFNGKFTSALQLRAPLDENAVAALFRETVAARDLRRSLLAVPTLNPQRKSNALRFECRQLF